MAANRVEFRVPHGLVSNKQVNILFDENSTNIDTGSLIIAGGVGIGGSLNVGEDISTRSGYGIRFYNPANNAYVGFGFTGTVTQQYTWPLLAPTVGAGTSVLTANSSGLLTWVAPGVIGVDSLNALQGGAQFLVVGAGGSTFNIASSGSTHTFNIPLAGTAITGLISPNSQTIAGDKTFSGNLAVTGNLTVNGTTTTVNSTITTVVDPVLTIGTAIGGTNPSTDDNKDRGIEFKYFSGTAKTGFFGFDDSTGFFTFIPDAANSSEVFSGTAGTLDVNRITGSAASWTNSRTVTFSGGGVTGSFSIDGSANVTGIALTVTDDSIALGTKTTGQYASTVSISGSGITATSANASDGTAYTIYSSAVSTNTASSIVLRDSSGNFSAGTITGTLSGTATSAQILNTTTDNSSTLYILGTRSDGGFAGTSIYVNTGISALGNTITAITFTGSLSGTASSSALINIDASIGTRYLLGTALNTASGSTQVSVGSGITIGNNLLTSGGIAVTNSTASSSTTSGALVVTGGVGIGASVNIGGKVGINTGVYTGAFNITTPSSSTPGIVVQGSASQTADYLQLLSSAGATSLRIDKDGKIIFPQQSSIQLFAETYSSTGRIRTSGPMIVYGAISSLSDGINESYLSSGTLYIQGLQWTPYGSPARWSTNNAVRIQPTSTSVVPLVVQLQNASWTSGNAFEIQNNGVLKFNVDYAGNTSILSTTGSGSTTTGALIVSGGVGIGGSLNIYQTTTANDNVLINAAKEIRFYNSSNTFYTGIKAGVTTSSTTFTLPIVDGTANQVLLTNGSAALGFTTALLGLNGLNTATQTFATSISGSGFTIASSTSTHTFYIGLAGNASTGLISAASQSLYGAKTFVNDTAISSSTASTSTSTGALTVTGGVGIGGSLWTSTTNFSSISGVGHSNSTITSGTWAGNAVSAIYGGTGYTSYTKGDLLAGNGSTFVKLPVGTNNQYLISDSSTGSGLSWYSIPSATYGAFYRSTSQTVAANTATPVIFNGTFESNNVSIFGGAGTSSRIKIDTAGTYNIQFSAQMNLSDGTQPSLADFWFRIDGTNVPNSNSRQTVGGKDEQHILSLNFVSTFSAGQYFELVMSSADVHFIIEGLNTLTSPTRPDIPSMILTVTPVMETVGGNSLTVAGTNNGDIQYKSNAALGASSSLNFDSATSTFKITGFPIEAVSGTSANVKLLGGSASWSGNINGTMLAINTANTYAGDLFNAQIGGTSRFKVSYTGAVSIGNSYTLPITDGTANQVLKTDGAGSVSWSDSVISSAQYNIGYYASAGTALTGSSTFTINTSTGVVSIGHTTSSTGFSTGALVVTGGVGVGGSSHFNNTLHITSSTASTNTTTGALIVDGGAGIAGTVNIGGHIRIGTNTFSKAGMGAGDILFDNGSADTPASLYYWANNRNFGTDVYFSGSGTTRYRIVKELNESGGAELWSIDREGIVYRSAWAVGETINTRMYNYSDLGMSATTTISSTSYATFATITYTPKSSSSYIWIEFSCTYNIAGAAADDFWSNIEVNGSEIVNANQVWVNGAGGGTRSGVLFPLAARYTNSGTAGIAVSIRAKRGTSDDNGTIYGNVSSGYMRIQEIGR